LIGFVDRAKDGSWNVFAPSPKHDGAINLAGNHSRKKNAMDAVVAIVNRQSLVVVQ